jgi:hypothetical protein
VEHAITRDTQASLVARIHDLKREIQVRQKRDRKRTRAGRDVTFFGSISRAACMPVMLLAGPESASRGDSTRELTQNSRVEHVLCD